MSTKTAIIFCVFLAHQFYGQSGALAADDLSAAAADAQAPVVQTAADEPVTVNERMAAGWADNPEDEKNKLRDIEIRAAQTEALIPVSLVQPFRDAFTDFNDAVYDATYLRFGLSFHHVFQGATDVLPGTDDYGATTDFDFVGTWELFNRGEPTQGEVFFGVEGRWDYGTIGPQNIGFGSIGAAGGTANSFSAYTPTFILRNLYYRQGGPEAGWAFRFGKITPDSMLLTNRNITPNTTFLPNAGTGVFAAGFADSGLGIAGNLFLNDYVSIGGLIADANGNRFNWGDIGEGQFYTAAELGLKIAPVTDQAGNAKFLLWHTDGTKDGMPINANTGRSGWGFGIVAEQELTKDGRLVIVGRYGKSFDKAAIYDQQAGVHLLLYEPTGRFENDVVGVAFNWIDSAFDSDFDPVKYPNTRQEYSLETFYRFPLLPDVDATLAYQAVIDPAFAATLLDFSSVFSLRLTSSF